MQNFLVVVQIRIRSGNSSEQRYAKGIYPLRRRGNWLLCTLILGNTATNTLLSIVMADLTNGFVSKSLPLCSTNNHSWIYSYIICHLS
jgi:metal transporter CNNM